MLIIERHFGDDVRLYEDVSPTLKKDMGDGGGQRADDNISDILAAEVRRIQGF